MERQQFYELPQFAAILTFIDAIFAEINVGLLIYHVEQQPEPRSARLIYANREASRLTGTDLGPRIGKAVFEAFPGLAGTDFERLFGEVIRTGESRRFGVVEYGDASVEHARYATRAFPMPGDCVGIVFENLSREPWPDGSR